MWRTHQSSGVMAGDLWRPRRSTTVYGHHVWIRALVLLAACGDPSAATDAGGDDGNGGGDGRPDGQIAVHTGGWRSPGHDPSRTNRLEVSGPGATATATTFFTIPVNGATIDTPIVDENGNLYMRTHIDGAGDELTSLAATGSVRWHVRIPGQFLSPLALGPDGHLYTLDAVAGQGSDARIVVYDTDSGAVLDYSPPLVGHTNFDINLVVSSDGKIFLRSNTAADGYRLRMFTSLDHVGWSVSVGGSGASGFGGYAYSPAKNLVVVPVSASTSPPFTIVALDAETGNERWRYLLDAAWLKPIVAIDDDGAVYVAAAPSTGNMHVIKLSNAGQVVWDHLETALRAPKRILIGRQSVVVAADASSNFNGGVILNLAGVRQSGTFTSTQCNPTVIDANDIAYWGCPYDIQATDAAGNRVHAWSRQNNLAFGFNLVAGPDGTIYDPLSTGSTSFPPELIRLR